MTQKTDLVRLVSDFEGNPITTIEVSGRPAWVAGEVARAIGYEQPRKLSEQITSLWLDDMVEGKDYIKVIGSELKHLKALYTTEVESPLIEKNAPSAIVLFESGLHTVLLHTDKPAGKALRRKMVDEILPQIARTGEYTPKREVVGDKVVEKATGAKVDTLALRWEKERRLAEEQARRTLKRNADVIRDLVTTLHASGSIDTAVRDAYLVEAAQIETGKDLAKLLPVVVPGWETATDIAKRNGVSANKVGRIANALEVKKEGMARAVLNKSQHSNHTCESWQYGPEAVSLIEAEIARQKGH